MNSAIKISLLCSGLFLLAGMLIGVLKYQRMMQSAEARAPPYVDIAQRAAFLDGFAALVVAKLLEYNPYSEGAPMLMAGVPLFYFVVKILEYFWPGFKNKNET